MQVSNHRQRLPAASHPLAITAGLCALAAAAVLAAFPPIGWWPLAVLAPALLTVAAQGAASTRRAFWLAAVSFFFAWLLLQRWMIDVTAIGWPVLAAYMALYPALFAAIVRMIRNRTATTALPMALAAPLVWTSLEFIRGDLWMDGYPWFLIGHPMVEWPILAQSADLFGPYFTSFLLACVGGALADLWLASEARNSWKLAIGGGACSIVLAGGNMAYGGYRMGESGHLTPGPRILAIQTNLPQDNKMGWTREEQIVDVQEFIRLTRTAFEQVRGEADLIVWPETMVPGLGLEPENILFQRENNLQPEPWLDVMLALHRELDRPLLVGNSAKLGLGLERKDAELHYTWEHSYNSAYLVDGEPPFQRYDKLFLTPFGETMPYISKWPWLERQLLDLGAAGMTFDLEPGARAARIAVETQGAQLAIATPICFEDAVARVMRRLVWNDGEKVAPLIVNLSNDGWFGSFDGGRLQHVQIARFRCIENRAPMVRSANTGLSAHIDSCGRIIAGAVNADGDDEWLMQQPGWLLADVEIDSRQTFYAAIGDLFAWMCLATTLAALALGWISRGRKAEP